jgi:serine phosphatase RsbU (regulator of sigma subunit)
MLSLHITPAEGEPFDHVVESDDVVIGRSTRCDLALADRFLSRQHARLYRADDEWLIEDLGSRNGTFVNGRKITIPTPVGPGDVITMSASLIHVTSGQAASGVSTTSDALFRPATDVLLQSQTPPPIESSREHDALRRYADRLAMLNEVHQALARSISLDELLELILDGAFQHLRPEQAAIFLRDEPGEYIRAASRSLPDVRRELAYSEHLVNEVAGKGMAALVLDTLADQRFAEATSLLDAGVTSLVAAPLLHDEGALGLIVLGSNAAVRRFSEEDLELLVTLASVAAMRISNVALAEEAVERRRLEHELELARRIQVALLPERLPEFEGYGLYGTSSASRGVSGDYYEVIDRAGGSECVLLVADVAGKGISASLLTSYLEALISTPLEAGLEPDEIFTRAGGTMSRRTPSNRFATVFLAVLEPATGGLRYANAGHPPACLVRGAGEVEWLGPTGMPLGMLEGSSYSTETSSLEPGDTLVLYSDGVTEAEDDAERQFGQERLAEVCVANRSGTPGELATAIDRAVEEFAGAGPIADDRTIVVVRRER